MRINTIVSIGLILTASAALAECPVFLDKGVFKAGGLHTNPTSTALYSYSKAAGWQSQALQVVGINDNGLIDMRANNAPAEADLASYRFMFYPEVFGEEAPHGVAAPCPFRRRFLLKTQVKPAAYAYMFWCREDAKPLNEHKQNFLFDPHKRRLSGDFYGYAYNKRNNILFDDIWVEDQGKDINVARKAELKIRADIRNFFAFDFGVDDTESRIKYQYAGPVSFVSSLDFFLNILFFKINLELNTSLSFFNRAVHVPMILHMPADATHWVHPGSGIFYSWQSKDEFVHFDLGASRLPQFDAALIKQGYKKVAEKALSYCQGEDCVFELVMRLRHQPVTMQFRMARYLVERGFYPVWVADLRQAEKDLGWPQSSAPTDGWRQSAVYFENSGTKKGEHKWDFWLNIHASASTLGETCPMQNVTISAF